MSTPRAALALVTALIAGCAAAPVSPEIRPSLGTVQIMPAPGAPIATFEVPFARSKSEGAAKGALAGSGAVAISTLAVASGPMAPFVIAIGVVGAGLAAVAGGVAGAYDATPAQTVEQVDASVQRAVSGLDASARLAAELARLARDEALVALGEERPDTRAEVAISEIRFQGCVRGGIYGVTPIDCPTKTRAEPYIRIRMKASIRLVSLPDGGEIRSREFDYQSRYESPAYWQKDDGKQIAAAFEHAYARLAEAMHETVLAESPIELPWVSLFGRLPSMDRQYGACWLAPEVPEPIATVFGAPCLGYALFPEVPSVTPELRWTAFPRELDRQALPREVVSRITDVRYDLRIWQADGCAVGAHVYERHGLEAAVHRVETALAPGQRYFWSMRARFSVAGRRAATRWGYFQPVISCDTSTLTEDPFYYRFVTPP